MKRKTLLFLLLISSISYVHAQKTKKITAYAITGAEKGGSNWTEVRLVDVISGEEVKTIYQTAQQIEILNARTKKAIVKKDIANDLQLNKEDAGIHRQVIKKDADGNVIIISSEMNNYAKVQSTQPFATKSAACAYDKKHERLYYTPMGINQLRYIDLKSKTSKIYYFEDEVFGTVKNSRDVANQITRMVFASDGNGYALTNDGNHLIRFTTNKKAQITDLGAVTDDPANAISVHSEKGYGGDMVADAQKNLYLITANRAVFKISLDTRVAAYLGRIKGLPKSYSTNGAVVQGGSTVIVSSSGSTQGYYKFDLNTLQSEKLSSQGAVFNASDLANGTLAFADKKKEPVPEPQTEATGTFEKGDRTVGMNSIVTYPNPVLYGEVKLSFTNQPEGRYQIQFMDIAGKIISTKEVVITNKLQIEEFRLPKIITKGNYMINVVNQATRSSVVNHIAVQ